MFNFLLNTKISQAKEHFWRDYKNIIGWWVLGHGHVLVYKEEKIMSLQIERIKLKILIEGKYLSLYQKPCVFLKYSWDELLK